MGVDFSSLTVVVLTYERQKYALRNMHFWNDTNAQLYVMDGSKNAIPESELHFFKPNIHYKHLQVSYYDRLAAVLPLIDIDAKYVVLQGDDEFYSLSTLKHCLDELDGDNSLVACCGHVVGFDYDPRKDDVIGYEVYPKIGNQTLLHETAAERVYHHSADYTPTHIYSVIRRDAWVKTMEIVVAKEFDMFAAHEIQFTTAICFMGKSKVLPELFWYRSGENEEIRGMEPALDLDKLIYKVWSKDGTQRREILEIMTRFLSPYVASDAEAYEIVERGFTLHAKGAKKVCRPNYWRMRKFVRAIYLFIIPSRLAEKIREKRKALRENQYTPHPSLPEFLSGQNKYKFDPIEVENLYRQLKEFHREA